MSQQADQSVSRVVGQDGLLAGPAPRRKPPRDHRLDVWRGLCLIDMVLVHLVSKGMQFSPFTHEFFVDYTRFAAGGYVMLSGATVGYVFFPRVLKADTRRHAFWRLIRRAAYIFWIHAALTIGQVLVLAPMRGETLPPWGVLVRDTLFFREGYDLLPFYIIMLALCPLVLEMMRRRLGWLVGVLSLAVFAYGHHVGADQQPEYSRHSFAITSTFFLMLWQLPFLLGLCAGTRLQAYDAWAKRTKILTMMACFALSVFFFFAAYGSHFNLALNVPGLVFWKTPLTFGELLRYGALVGLIVTSIDLAWRWLDGSLPARFVARLGRRSLAMYIAQIFLVAWIDNANDWTAANHAFPGYQACYMVLSIVILWCIAWAMDAMFLPRRQTVDAAAELRNPVSPRYLADSCGS